MSLDDNSTKCINNNDGSILNKNQPTTYGFHHHQHQQHIKKDLHKQTVYTSPPPHRSSRQTATTQPSHFERKADHHGRRSPLSKLHDRELYSPREDGDTRNVYEVLSRDQHDIPRDYRDISRDHYISHDHHEKQQHVTHDLPRGSSHNRPSPRTHATDTLLLRDHRNRSHDREVASDYKNHKNRNHTISPPRHHHDDKQEWSYDSIMKHSNRDVVGSSNHHNPYHHHKHNEKQHRNRDHDIHDIRSSFGNRNQHHRGRDEEPTRSPKVFIVEDPKSHQIHPQQSQSLSYSRNNNIEVILPGDEREAAPLQQHRHHKQHSPSRDSSATSSLDCKSQNLHQYHHHQSWKDQSSMLLTPTPSSKDRPSPSSTNAYKHWHHYSVTTSEVSPNREVMTQKKEIIPSNAPTTPSKKIHYNIMQQQYPDTISTNSNIRKSLLELKFEHRLPPHHQDNKSVSHHAHHHHGSNTNNKTSTTSYQRINETTTSSSTTASHSSRQHSLPVGTPLDEKKLWCLTCDGEVTKRLCGHDNLVVQEREKEFPCPTCKRIFNNRSHLKRHNMIHSGEKPWACTYCEKRFNRKSHLNRHVLTHTGERPFK